MAEPPPPPGFARHPAPAWLVAAVEQRVAFLVEQMGGRLPPGYPVVLTMLTEPPEGATDAERERWERICDHCGVWVPPDRELVTGSVGRRRGPTLVEITYGACPACARMP